MATRSLITEYVKDTNGNYNSVEIHPITDSASVLTTTTQTSGKDYASYTGLPLETGSTSTQETVLQSLLKTRSRLYELRAFNNVTINTTDYSASTSDNSVPSSKVLNSAINSINLSFGSELGGLKTKVNIIESNITDVGNSSEKHIRFLERYCFPVKLYNKNIMYLAGMSDLLNANGVGNTAFIDKEGNPLIGDEEKGMEYDRYGYKISIFRGREKSDQISDIWNSTGNTFENEYLQTTPGIILLDTAFFIRVHRYSDPDETLELLYHRGEGNLETFLSYYDIEITEGRDPHAPKGHIGYILTNNCKYNFAIVEYFKLWY